MKRFLILFSSSLLFSLLFYRQDFGLNFLLFAVLAIVLVGIFRPAVYKRWDMLLATAAYLASSIFVCTNNSSLAIINTYLTFIIFAGSISGINNSIFVQGFNGLYQTFLGVIHYNIDNKKVPKKKTKSKYDIGFIALVVVIVGTLLLLFASLYGKANPIFSEWLDAIDLSFINMGWIIFTTMGYGLLYNLTTKAELDIMTLPDRAASNDLKEQNIPEARLPKLYKEKLLGTIVLSALNALLIFFLTLDIWYVFQNPLEDAAALSRTLHEGVNALIISIVIAIAIIVALFRNDLNFIKNNHRLRVLTYVWIGLNIILIGITVYKNNLYVGGFGLTYKRIGVYIYLTLAFCGLLTAFFKVAQKKNVLYMIRSNARLAFIVLVLMSSFSWDRTIIQHNTTHLAHPDMNYLLTVDNNAIDLLYAFAKAQTDKAPEYTDITNRYKEWRLEQDEKNWQELTLQSLTKR